MTSVREELETLDLNSMNGSELFSIVECADPDEHSDPATTAIMDQKSIALSHITAIVASEDRTRDNEPNNNGEPQQEAALDITTPGTADVSGSRTDSDGKLVNGDNVLDPTALIAKDVPAQKSCSQRKRRPKSESAKHHHLPKRRRKKGRRRQRQNDHYISHSFENKHNRAGHAHHTSRGTRHQKQSKSTSKHQSGQSTFWDYLSWIVRSWFLRCISG